MLSVSALLAESEFGDEGPIASPHVCEIILIVLDDKNGRYRHKSYAPIVAGGVRRPMCRSAATAVIVLNGGRVSIAKCFRHSADAFEECRVL